MTSKARRGGRRGTSSNHPILSQRALNRALLARQLLLKRQALSPIEAVERLAGLQAQSPFPPYFGLWTRLDPFAPQDLASLIEGRQVVRASLMRGTIHLVSAHDCLAWRPLVRPIYERLLVGDNPADRGVAGPAIDEVVQFGRRLLQERPHTRTELEPLLSERWPDQDTAAVARIVYFLAAEIQTPPRAVWGKSGPASWTTAESWLGRPLDATPSPDDFVLRYLGAFGPASVMDAQRWSGLTRLGEVFDRLRPRLSLFQDERGRELFDLPDAPRPDPETPTPVRFLPEFDNLTLSHADRTRIITDEHRVRIASKNGMIPGMILLDGLVAGTWRIEKTRRLATLLIASFVPLTASDREMLANEGRSLLAFASADAGDQAVTFAANS